MYVCLFIELFQVLFEFIVKLYTFFLPTKGKSLMGTPRLGGAAGYVYVGLAPTKTPGALHRHAYGGISVTL